MSYQASDHFKNNARYASMKHIERWLIEHNAKRMIEFGTSRVRYEGNSTIFLALMARQLNARFTSVDVSQDNINKAISIVQDFDASLLGNIEFVCQDQYTYMKLYNEHPAQYVYLDADDNQKHKALETLLQQSAIWRRYPQVLDNPALICIDDMITQDAGCIEQVQGVVDLVNSYESELKPLNRIDDGEPLNAEQLEWQERNKKLPKVKDEDNIRQFEYQILLEYNNA
jgi:predicted O-methyltransferase YrrM